MKSPHEFVNSFTDDRLITISQVLLEECYSTDDSLNSPYDSNYGIKTTRFDRQRNRLLDMPLQYPWLKPEDTSLKLVMSIDGAPFRFLSDDPYSPKKDYAKKSDGVELYCRNNTLLKGGVGEQGRLEVFKLEPSTPITWRFFCQESENEEGEREYDISFVGYDLYEEISCVWNLSDHISSGYVSSVDSKLEEAVQTESAKTTLPFSQERHAKKDDQEK